jgi:hypothetical protein
MLILAKVTLVELSVKYIVKSFEVLWQHVFQAVVCVSSAMQSVTLSHSDNSTKM